MKPTFNRLSRLSRIALAVSTLTAGTGFAASDTWSVDANGNWNDATKWQSGTQFPDGLGDIATFGGTAVTITAPRTITLNANATVGGLTLDNRGSSGIALPSNATEFSSSGFKLDLGTKVLTLDTGTAGFNASDLVIIDLPTTNLTGHNITGGTGRLNLVDNVEIRANTTTNPGGVGGSPAGNPANFRDNRVELSMSSALSGTGNLTKTGRGQLLLAGDSPAYSGTVRVVQGLVQLRGNNNGPTTGNTALGTGTVVLTNGLATSTVINGIEMDGAQLGFNNYSNVNGLGDPVFANALVLEATHASRNFELPANACSYTWSGNISNTGALPANVNFNGAGRAASWVTFTGDNSGLSLAAGKRILASSTYFGIGNANALGLGNNQPVRLVGGSLQSGAVATIATTIASDIIADSGSNQAPAVVGANITSGTVTFNTGGLKFNQNNHPGLRNNFLQSKTGGTVVFNNVISSGGSNGSPVYKNGGGVVELNGANTYTGLSGIRSGSLVLGHNNALGGSTNSVSLGQPIITVANVKAASITGVGTFTTTNGGTLTGAGTSLDGVTLVTGDRVLVKDDNTTSKNGIYEVTATAGTWQRVAELNDSAELLYGIQVTVTSGKNNAGKTFYQAMGVPGTAGVLNTDGLSFLEGDVINPDASLLLKGGIALNRNITVVANGSTGKSILGGVNTTGTSTFSGAVTLNRDLTLTAAAGGSVDFSGNMTGGFGVTKEGPGTVVLSTAKTYGGATTIKAGTLKLTGGGGIASPNIIVGDTGSSGAVLDVTAKTGGFTVGGTQTVSGIGTLDATGQTVSVSGSIAPGNSAGLLSVSTNALQLSASSALNLEMTRGVTPTAGSNYDQLGLTGGIAITPGAALNLTALGTGTWNLNDIFFLINNDGGDAISGTFNGYTEGGTFTFDSQLFKVTYLADYGTSSFTGGNDLAVQVIPETSAALLGSLGMLALLRRRRADR